MHSPCPWRTSECLNGRWIEAGSRGSCGPRDTGHWPVPLTRRVRQHGRMSVEPASIEVLSRDECLALLARHGLGRLAILVGGRPDIVPVNYALGPGGLVIHTRHDGLLDRATRLSAAFEIDGIDSGRRAWSVTVRGTLEDITGAVDHRSVALQTETVTPLAPGERRSTWRFGSTT